MKISELEKRSGISAHTLRYYEKAGLLTASQRTANNYREYSLDDLATAKFIFACKNSGFTLADTSALLAIKDNKEQHVCAEAKIITNNKIKQITEQIEQLKKMQNTLTKLEKICHGGSQSAEFCSIIAALEGEQ